MGALILAQDDCYNYLHENPVLIDIVDDEWAAMRLPEEGADMRLIESSHSADIIVRDFPTPAPNEILENIGGMHVRRF